MKKRILLITMSILFAFSALACAKQPAPVATPADAVDMTIQDSPEDTATPVVPETTTEPSEEPSTPSTSTEPSEPSTTTETDAPASGNSGNQ